MQSRLKVERPTTPELAPGLRGLTPFRQGKSEIPGHMNPIKLSANESHHGPSPAAAEAYRQRSSELFRYPDGAQVELRRAIAEVFGIRAEGIVCGNGSDELLQLLIRAYVRPGDEVVLSRNCFAMASVHASAQGARIVYAEEPELRPDTDSLLAAANAETRAVVIASPNNPVGQYLPREELIRLRRGLADNTLLIVDAAYADYVVADDFDTGQSLVESGSNTVMTRTFSKIHGLASLRIGWMYGPAHVIDAVNRIRGPFNVATPAMLAGVASLADTAHLKKAHDHNAKWLAWLTDEIGKLGFKVTPSVANFLLIHFP